MIAILDTHAVLWVLSDDPRLGRRARELVLRAERGELAASDITLLEISMLESKKRIRIRGTIQQLLDEISTKIRILPINAAIAAEAMALDLAQADPFDRVIVATARTHRAELVTRDQHIREANVVPTVW